MGAKVTFLTSNWTPQIHVYIALGKTGNWFLEEGNDFEHRKSEFCLALEKHEIPTASLRGRLRSAVCAWEDVSSPALHLRGQRGLAEIGHALPSAGILQKISHALTSVCTEVRDCLQPPREAEKQCESGPRHDTFMLRRLRN